MTLYFKKDQNSILSILKQKTIGHCVRLTDGSANKDKSKSNYCLTGLVQILHHPHILLCRSSLSHTVLQLIPRRPIVCLP